MWRSKNIVYLCKGNKLLEEKMVLNSFQQSGLNGQELRETESYGEKSGCM